MRIEITTKTGRQKISMSTRAFGKLLHLARFNGWEPEKEAPDYPSGSWDTEIFLPNIGPYLSGTVSNEDARALMRALNRANATGEVAMDQTLVFPAMGLLDIARGGGFEVRFLANPISSQQEYGDLAVA